MRSWWPFRHVGAFGATAECLSFPRTLRQHWENVGHVKGFWQDNTRTFLAGFHQGNRIKSKRSYSGFSSSTFVRTASGLWGWCWCWYGWKWFALSGCVISRHGRSLMIRCTRSGPRALFNNTGIRISEDTLYYPRVVELTYHLHYASAFSCCSTQVPCLRRVLVDR